MKQIIDDSFLSVLESRDLRIEKAMQGLFGGNRRSQAYGNSAEFADFREYAPGDDLRRIDWNLYARFEKLYLKLFVDERQLHHKIYIDASASMDWGEPNKSHTALKLAAAIGFLSVQAMDRVSFYAIHKNSCEDLCRTIVGKDAFYRAVNVLNNLPFYGDGNMGTALNALEDPGYGNGVSVIISDFLTDCDWKSGVDKLLYHKRDVWLIQVLSRDEISPALSGKLLMLDAEGVDEDDRKNYKIEVTRSSVKAYEEAFLYHQRDIHDFCAIRKIPFITVCSDESIERMLLQKATEVGMIL